MRPTLFIAASVAVAIAGHAFAAPAAGTSSTPSNDAPMQSTTPSSPTTPPDTTTPPSSSSSSSSAAPPTGAAADTSATAGATAALTVGEPVKDNAGATIGAISSLSTAANGQQMAVIKMGADTFQVPSDRLGSTNGAATINLSQSQIAGMLHPPAGGK